MIIFIGIVLISQSMYSIGKRLSNVKYADQRIKKIDEVLNLYNVDYKVDVRVQDEFGTGLKEVTADVKLSNSK